MEKVLFKLKIENCCAKKGNILLFSPVWLLSLFMLISSLFCLFFIIYVFFFLRMLDISAKAERCDLHSGGHLYKVCASRIFRQPVSYCYEPEQVYCAAVQWHSSLPKSQGICDSLSDWRATIFSIREDICQGWYRGGATQKREPMSDTSLGLCDSILSILILVKLVLCDVCEVCTGTRGVLSKYEFKVMARKGWLYT